MLTPDGGSNSRRPSSSGVPLQQLNTSPGAGASQSTESQGWQRSRYESTDSTGPGHLAASTYWDQPYDTQDRIATDPDSPIDPSALQAALPPSLFVHEAGGLDDPFANGSPYAEEQHGSEFAGSDREPLTSSAQPIAGSLAAHHNDGQPRSSFQTVSDIDNSPGRDRQRDIEHGLRPSQHQGFGMMLNPVDYRLSRAPSSAGALSRAGSIVRAMSQRVVNISGESEVVDKAARHVSGSPQPSRTQSRTHTPAHSREPSREPSRTRSTGDPMGADTSYMSQTSHLGTHKYEDQQLHAGHEHPHASLAPLPNFLKGRSLGIFPPDSRIRNRLCDLLVNPYTEPVILLLIVLQAVLLAVESSKDVFADGKGRPDRWGQQPTDWAILGLFIVFTLELIVRIIVSGFILNAAEYSTIDRKRGIKAAVTEQYRAIFQPQQTKSAKAHNSFKPTPSAFARSFTTFVQGPQRLPATVEEQQRFQLARRAFLRHGFNRLDFVAVGAYWISLILGITGLESEYRLYVFKMLSCLRILRLLSITNGTAIILRSLKKAAPLLVRVAFFISFFWLLFAIVGVQSFKESLSRQCTWIDPDDPSNLDASYTNEEAFCGGYIDNRTGHKHPWVFMTTPGSLENLVHGSNDAKGFICPRGSLCLQQGNPAEGTVNFDNIFHSLELVFVIMSANTFSDIMYWTMGSDYMLAALYFGAGIMIMLLWLVNLLIAVITSSFQVIREESRSSAFTADVEPLVQERTEERYQKLSFLQTLYKKTFYFWVVVIALGLVAQSLRSDTMSATRTNFIDIAEVAVTIILACEMILRISADWRNFHRSWRNLFDLGLVVITSIILIPPIRGTRAYWWLSVFQILRAYRVVLAIPVTRKLILLVLGNASGIANLMLFVFLMTFLVAILAAQLFRGIIPKEDADVSFYNILNSFIGMYQIVTSENWTDILYNVTSYTTTFRTSWIGAAFLIAWFILSFFILINMFIAVIQENFDISEDEKRFEQVKAFLQRREIGSPSSNLALSTIFSFGRTRQRKDPLDNGPLLTETLLKDSVVRDFLEESYNRGQSKTEEFSGPSRATTGLLTNDIKPGYLSTLWGRLKKKVTKREPNPFYSNVQFEASGETFNAREMAQQAVTATATRRKAQRAYLAKHPRYNVSLFLFSPKNKFRRLCQTLVGPARGLERLDGVEPNKLAWYSFSAFIYAAIVAMVLLACITTPLYQKQYQADHPFSFTNWYVWTDMAFAVLFSAESIIKVIADGVMWTPNAYLRSSWGIVDAIVLVTLWINVVTLFINDGAISRAVGAFKALRALRLLNVSDSARNTFHSLIIVGWWKILAAAFVSISLLIPFAIYGLNLFSGLLISCNDDGDNIISLSSCFGEFNSEPFSEDWPLLAPRVADNPYFNFDDFGASLFTLFQVVSQEGWSDVVFAASAITSKGMQPQSLASEGNAFFFILFNIMATVFVLTLFISVFMRNYTEQTGVAFLTAEQRSWLEVRKLLRQISPSKSSYNDKGKAWKKWCHKRAIEKRGKWYQTITVVLVLHLILLVAEFTGEPLWWQITRIFIFLIFVFMYAINIVIRIIGLGWTRYRRRSWDLYALIAVFGAFVSTTAMLFARVTHMGELTETYEQVHKFFLVAIVLMIIPRNDALDQLFKTAAASLTVIGNLLATWLVLFLVFAIAFTQAFSLTRFGENEDYNVNFRTVPKALILLFRMSLGEGWNGVMEDYAFIEPPLCVAEADFFESDCGSKSWARFLFVAWNIVSMYIFVNLFVSLIYESFSYVYQRSSGMGAIDRDEIRRFKEAWRIVDPNGSGWITKDMFPQLLSELSGVFAMHIYDPEDSIHSILEDVRGHDHRASRHMSIVSAAQSAEIDLAALNQRLARLDVPKIRERRRRFNIFYNEIMTGSHIDKGIAFSDVLMTLAQYNIITDSKSLKLDEFLRRRARLQRVDEDLRRKTVQGFFDTVYWRREFNKHVRHKQAGRMTGIPEIMVPDIYVDDDNIDGLTDDGKPKSSGIATPASHLSVDLGHGNRGSGGNRGSAGSRGSSPGRESSWVQPGQHPLSAPRMPTSGTTLPSHQASTSAFSFDLLEPEGQGSASGEMRRRGSASNSSTQARDILDETVWMDSIRKSATVRRSKKGNSYRFTDLG